MFDPSVPIGPGGLIGGLLIALVPLSAAQQPADSIRKQALRDYHGPDLKGKDGPLAKAGLDLLVLYHEYQAFRKRGADTFKPSISGLRVAHGHVTIDAVGAEPEQLLDDLQALGLKNGASAGRVVSGRFPIVHIPSLARLESLRGVLPSRMQTQDNRPRARDAPRPPDAASQFQKETSEPLDEEKEPVDGNAGADRVLFLLAALFAALGLIEM